MRPTLNLAVFLGAVGWNLASAPPTLAADPPRPPSLKTVPVPEPSNLTEFVRDREAAILLGKALFWDQRIGSDGRTACATCHFHAGADSRSRNQRNPGTLRIRMDASPDPDTAIDGGPNRTLTAADFPLWPRSNDVVSSQGVPLLEFLRFGGRAGERTRVLPDPDGFALGRASLRRVEPRNTPTVINAIFNHRNFWDGRAAAVFNGVNGLGLDDPDARLFRADDPATPTAVAVRIDNASLASQALAPPTSDREMGAQNRPLHHLGIKLTGGLPELRQRVRRLRPLAHQRVAPDDSVLGPVSRWPGPGLTVHRYEDLIERAFQPQWWNSTRLLRLHPGGHVAVVETKDGDPSTKELSLLQYNFSLFFGLAIQLYESTLVADDSPYDRFMDGDPTAVDALALAGVDVFRSQARGRCINCHENAELTGASVRRVTESPLRIREGQALDRGFNNIGVRPTLEDPGVGGRTTNGLWLSTTRRHVAAPPEPIAVDGAMKVPGLRNVALTAPYFHNGGFLTLGSVLEFYSRGGDVRPQRSTDGSLEIAPLNVLDNTEEELAALEAFLHALTDERVRFRRAPFDHPQLFVPDGTLGPSDNPIVGADGLAREQVREIPAVGRFGGEALPGFLE